MNIHNEQPADYSGYKKFRSRATYLFCFGILSCISFQSVNAAKYKYNKEQTTVYILKGQANVKANELVYSQPMYGYPVDHKLSQLIWESQAVKMLVAGVNISSGKSSSINMEAKFGLMGSERESVMDDYDWLKAGLDWTHWSHHEDTSLTNSMTLDFNFESFVYQSHASKLSFLVGYRNETWAWESRGGNYIYSSATGYRDLSGSFTPGVRVISYKQEFSMPYLGFDFETLLGKWKFNFQYNYSGLVQVKSTDNHYLRDLIIVDEFDTGTMSSYKMAIHYQMFKSFNIFVRYDVQKYEEVRGNSTYIDSSTGAITGWCVNCAGADNSSQLLSIGASYVY